jgi:hypothetical protein
MEDKDCAEFYIKYIDSSYKISELSIVYEKYENSHLIITIKEFIDKIERDYISYYSNLSMDEDIAKIKSKVRLQVLNKLLDE